MTAEDNAISAKPGTPLARVLDLYKSEPPGSTSFIEDLQSHLNQGVVLSTPAFFVMARDEGGAWFVWCAAGNMLDMICAMPYYLPKIEFSRRGKGIDSYNTNRLYNAILRHDQKSRKL